MEPAITPRRPQVGRLPVELEVTNDFEELDPVPDPGRQALVPRDSKGLFAEIE